MSELTKSEEKIIIGIIVSIVGSILIITTMGWLAWLGIMLMIWGNNVYITDELNKVITVVRRKLSKK